MGQLADGENAMVIGNHPDWDGVAAPMELTRNEKYRAAITGEVLWEGLVGEGLKGQLDKTRGDELSKEVIEVLILTDMDTIIRAEEAWDRGELKFEQSKDFAYALLGKRIADIIRDYSVQVWEANNE